MSKKEELEEQIQDPLPIEEEVARMKEEIDANTRWIFGKREKIFKRIKKGEKISLEESMEMKEAWDVIREMEKSYYSLYKLAYPKGMKQEQPLQGRPDIEKVKEGQGTIVSIVQKTGGLANG